MADFSLGTAELGTSVDLSGLNKGLGQAEQETKARAGGIGGFFGRAFEFATGGLIASGISALGGAVTGFFSGAIGDARESNQVFAQTQAVIESTGGAAGFSADQIADMAGSLSAAAGKSLFGDDDIQRGQNMLLTFTGIQETLPEATSTMVDMAQAMGTDVKGGAIQLGKALNDPINGISALSRVGVTFTDEQKAQIKTMQDAGDMAGAQRVILAELNKEFGGSAEAAAKADGGMAQFKDQLGEAGETLGKALLPLLSQFVSFLNTSVMPVVQIIAGGIAELADVIGDAGIGSLEFAESLGGLATQLGFDGQAVQQMVQVLQRAFAVAVPFVTGLLSGQLLPVLGTMGTTFQGVQGVISGVMTAIQAVIGAVLGQLVAFWQAHGAEIMATAQSTWNQIQQIIALLVELIKATIIPAFQAIASFLNAHGAEIQAVLGGAWDVIRGVIQIALGLITGILQTALALIRGDWDGAWQAVKTTIDTVWAGIQTAIGGELDIIKGLLSMAWDAIKGVASTAWEGIKGAIGTAFSPVKEAIDGIANGVKTALDTTWGSIKGAASSAWESIKGAVDSAWEPVKGSVEGVISSLKTSLDGWWSTISGAASSAWSGIAGAIKSAFSGVVGGIKSVLNSMIDAINDAIRAFNSLPGPDIGTIPRLEAGTLNFAGGLAMLGEHGPELAALPQGTRVFNAADTRNLLGAGGGVNVTITLDDRGLGLLRQLIRVEVEQETRRISGAAGRRSRTR